MNFSKAYNFKTIDELTSSSGTIKHIDLASFSDAGYQTVINLLPDDNEHAMPGEKERLVDLGIEYVYIPVDWDKPTIVNYEEFEAAMMLNVNKHLHIHCAANYRATALYSIYASKNLGWSQEKIRNLMEPIWTLDDFPVWKSFVKNLIA